MKSAILLIVILGLLAVGALYSSRGSLCADKQMRIKMDLVTLASALSSYHAEAGRFPTTEQGLAALVHRPTARPIPGKWHATMKKTIQDPWARDYHYCRPGIHNPETFDVWSLGPDGIESIDDIGNWE